ncbi:hypothetical protein SAMN02910265_03091 [Ruminococcus flavefaciens]|uniref:Uncharacterized protein n=1 Tax=Ruminococcus flavefaciens TaxID=1265 RepID=A0A1H6LD06_RUMFL|nr:hypothetical protein [Ruminococcus flavefaciens]SEH86306.1 hypothetical protein SAMN02910265_03091 [Ruminococcus flavefaciens]
MAQYESLKDYLSLNRKDEILKKTNEYFQAHSNVKNNVCLKDITIITVSCVEEILPTAMVCMEVSAEVYINNNASVSSAYYSILFSGNVLKGFSGLNLISAGEISEKELHEEKIPALFGLPDITCDTLEEEAQKIHRILCAIIKKNPEHKYWFPVIEIKEKYKLKMWPAKLDDGVLGQIRFTPSRADIYDIRDMNKCFTDELIPANVILINSEYYKNHNNRYDDIIVATHELVHWNLHRLYFYISQLLDDNYQLMNCSSKPIVFDDSMSLKDRAYWYAEWQANELAIRVAMPKHLVEKAIEEYNNDESVHNPTDKPFSGMYYHHMIEKLSWDFNVPEVIVKERLRQLGYDYAEGTFVTVDDCTYKPFTFTQGTLKENETFVIDRKNYERLLRENKDFAELIESKICVYTGYVVCLYDAKYIKPTVNNGQISYELTAYAREHADECCLFYTLYSSHIINNYIFYGQKYLCNEADGAISEYSYDKDGNLIISRKIETIIDRRKKDAQLYDDINSERIKEFSVALTYIMAKLNLTKEIVAERIECSPRTIQNYRNSETPDSIEKVLLCCLGCQTGPKVSRFLIEKSVGGIPDVGLKRAAYEFLLENTNATLEIWNNVLKEFHLPPIYM